MTSPSRWLFEYEAIPALLELFIQLGPCLHQERKKQRSWGYVVPPPDQPSAERAPMMLSIQTIFKKGFTKTLYNLKQIASFHLKVFWPGLRIQSPSELIYAKTYNLKTGCMIRLLLLPSLAKAVIFLTHKSKIHDRYAQPQIFKDQYTTPSWRHAVIYVFCTSVPH